MKMNNVHKLLATQFLSALADNMILMATVYVITQHALGNIYVGIVQASFFVAYVLLAPYAGVLSEKIPKSNTLWIGNTLKLGGALLLLVGVDPAVSYALIGVGACIYGPGKYAILRELTKNEEELYRANGLVEGSTIVSALLGTVLGGVLVASSFELAMCIILACYVLSFLFAWILPKGSTSKVSFKGAWSSFYKDISVLWKIKEAKISLIGTSNFWMTSSVLRLAVLAWIPVALMVSDEKASYYMGISAIGIMLGAVLSPYLIPLHKLSRLIFIGSGMAVAIIVAGWVPHWILTAIILFIAGFFGGAFMIPLNTTLQEKGQSVGSGKVIAIQNFFENLLMLSGTLLYTGALKLNIGMPIILTSFGLLFLVVSIYVSHSYRSRTSNEA